MRRQRLVRLLGDIFGVSALICTLLTVGAARPLAAPVTVRYLEGVTHGFLVLRDPGGETLAEGDLLQVVRPEGVDSRLIFRFRDGSVYDETVVFTQQKVFTLMRYHLIQRGTHVPGGDGSEDGAQDGPLRGPRAPGRRRAGDGDGRTGPRARLYNGMMIMLLKNLAKGAAETVHDVAFTPKPPGDQLELASVGEETVLAGDRKVEATHFVMTPKLGLLRGAAAAVLGKTPPNYHCWVVTSGCPPSWPSTARSTPADRSGGSRR